MVCLFWVIGMIIGGLIGLLVGSVSGKFTYHGKPITELEEDIVYSSLPLPNCMLLSRENENDRFRLYLIPGMGIQELPRRFKVWRMDPGGYKIVHQSS